MKKSIFISLVLMMVSCFSNQLYAQETIAKQKTKSNNTNERDGSTNQWPILAVKISPTENGIAIVFDNAIVSPRDAASGLPTGKRMHKPVRFNISPSDNTITEVTSTSAMVSGQSSVGTKSTTTTPDPSNAPGNPIKGISVKGGRNPGGNQLNKIVVTDGEFSLPVDLADGEYEMAISFTYQKIEMGTAETKDSKSYVSGHFIIEIDGGVCRSIKEKGVR
ncbi:hypothetical protein [Flavobacterium sp.]|uniref:hypothetical protein n=1 Tax=Flavobacterium sp. TaxID=239 RepID=UPI0037536288